MIESPEKVTANTITAGRNFLIPDQDKKIFRQLLFYQNSRSGYNRGHGI